MAEYKGLTIRIGGDTSTLNSALKSSTKAAATLQSEIRQITRAMRFDPGNMGNIETRMKLTTNRAEALYQKISLTKDAFEQLGRSVVSVDGGITSVQALAQSTDNVALAASNANKRYEDMTANLASRYRELEERAKAAGQEMDLSANSRGMTGETFEKQMADLKELGVITDEEIDKLREMRAVWNTALENKEAYEAAQNLEKMSVNMQRLESEARGAAATVRELNTASRLSGEFADEAAEVKVLDSALSQCVKQARQYESIMRQDPTNITAAVGRLEALGNGFELAKEKADMLSQEIDVYENRLSGVLAEEKNLPKFIEQTRAEWQEVRDELSKAEGNVDAIDVKLTKLQGKQAPVEEIQKLEAELDKAKEDATELGTRFATLDERLDTANMCAELLQLQEQFDKSSLAAKDFQRRMSATRLTGEGLLNPSTIKSIGMSLYSTLTPAITMLGWRAVTAAQEMDTAYRDMRKTVNGTETQFEELKAAAIEFSQTHVTSAAQILQIEAIGGELGIATENLQAFAETVSNLEVATNLDAEGAAESLGKLANITHMGADEYDKYADALVRLGNNGASTEDQIVDIATRIGSMGTIVGMTVPEILALSSTIAATGMKTEASGTAISNTLSDIESAVANGGDKLEAFARVAGTSAEEFAATWESKPVAAFKQFIEGLNQIEAEGGSAVTVLEEMGITGERQKQSILGLMQTIGGLNDNLTMSQHAWDGVSDAWGASGDAANEAAKKAEGFSGQIAILSNVGKSAMAALAEGATPIIAGLTQLSQTLLGVFTGMDQFGKSAVVVGLGLAAIAGPVMTVSASFLLAKNQIKSFIVETSTLGRAMAIVKQSFASNDFIGPTLPKMQAFSQAAKELGKSLAKNLAMAGVAAGITVAISIISDLIRKMQEAEQASRSLGDMMGSAFSGAASQQAGEIGAMTTSYDELVTKLANTNRKLQESANETFGKTALIQQYGDAVKEALERWNGDENGNGADRSAASMAELKAALEGYNSAAGTSISFTQDETGALHLMKDGAMLTTEAFNDLTAAMIRSTQAKFFQEGYEAKYSDYREALNGVAEAEKNVAQTEQDIADAKARGDGLYVESASRQLITYREELDKAKQKLGETQSAMNQFEEGMKLMAEASIEGASASVRWVADNAALQQSIWGNNQSVMDFAHNLDALGVGFDQLEKHKDGIQTFAQSWDGSVGQMISGLQALGIEIDLAAVHIQGLNEIKINNVSYWVDDHGTVYDQTGKVMGLKKEINGVPTIVPFEVTDNNSADNSRQSVDNLTQSILQVPDKWVEVVANVTGLWEVNSLAGQIRGLADKTVNLFVNTFKREQQSATGAYANSPFIPRHADGYIATRPTLTNHGWIGEDGAEAMLNWGSGGAVIPLTNEKYMLPIAKAIAHNMDTSSNVNQNEYHITVNASGDAEEIAREVTRAIRAQNRMRA